MKVSEFKKLIREEIRKVLNEDVANLPFHYPWTDAEKVAWVFELQGAEVSEKPNPKGKTYPPTYSLAKLPTKVRLWDVRNRSEYVSTDAFGYQMGKDYKYPVSIGFMGGDRGRDEDDSDEEISLVLTVVGSPETFQQIVKKYLSSSIKEIPMKLAGGFLVKTDLSPLANLILQASKKQPVQKRISAPQH